MEQLDQALALDGDARRERLAYLKVKADELMESTICQKRELEWDTPGVLRSVPRVVRSLVWKKKGR